MKESVTLGGGSQGQVWQDQVSGQHLSLSWLEQAAFLEKIREP